MLDTYEEEKVLFITVEDETLNTSLRYIEAGVTAVRVNPLSSDRASMAEGIESKLKEANFGRAGWMVSILVPALWPFVKLYIENEESFY